MKCFACFLIASLLVAGLVLFCQRKEIRDIQLDYQAYQKERLLPEYFGDEGKLR